MVAAALILAIGVPSAAVGFGEGRDAKLGKRNPSSGSLTRETQIIASNGSYGTRQSNKRNGEGGGAIYGCRSDAGKEPCVRANNLKGGRAFEFATVGKEAGFIQVGDTTAPPFSTNATGKVTNLDADKVDGKSARAALIAACTSRAAASILRFRSNCRLTRVEPLPEFEVISLTPAIVPSLRSSGVATLLAMVSGLAPGSEADTEMVG